MKESMDVNLLTEYVLIKCKRNCINNRWRKVTSEKDIELLTFTDTISVIIIGYMKETAQKEDSGVASNNNLCVSIWILQKIGKSILTTHNYI